MKILDQYLVKTIILAVVLVTIILMSIEMLVVFIGELGNLGTGNYGLIQAMRYVLLDMPNQLNLLFPMASLVGAISGLGLLANQSELIVMQTSGFSTWQILLSVLKAALFIGCLAFVMGEIIAPYTEDLANQGRLYAKTGGMIGSNEQDLFLRQGQQFIHIAKVMNPVALENIVIFDTNPDLSVLAATHAEYAKKIQKKWYLYHVKKTHFSSNHTSVENFSEQFWPVDFDPSLLQVAQVQSKAMSLGRLWHYIRYLKRNNLDANGYELDFWKRIFQPIAAIVMIFLAVPSVFGSLRTVAMGLRIVIGIALGFSFYIANQFFSSLGLLNQWPPFLTACFPTLLFLSISLWLFKRVKS